MKKLYLIFSFGILLSSQKMQAQDWAPVGVGINSFVYALCVFNNELYAGGNFTTAGNVFANNIASWNGTAWDTVGAGLNYPVHALAEYNGALYAGDIVGNVWNWDGTSWNTVGDINGGGNVISALCVYNGILYAGGDFNTYEDSLNGIAQWNGSAWVSVGGIGLNSGNGSGAIYALCVYNGELYAGGTFTQIGTTPAGNIAKWNGTSWSSPDIGVNGQILSLGIFNNELYAGGEFFLAGGLPDTAIAKWNGSAWSAVGSGYDGLPLSLTVYNGALYAGGDGTSINDVSKWNNTSWSRVGAGLYIGPVFDSASSSGVVYALCVYNGSLYAGGYFDYSGTTFTNYIARWPGVTGIEENNINEIQVNIYPNPTSGLFTLSFSKSIHDASLKIFNYLGEEIYNESIFDAAINNKEIDLKAAAGIYIVQVSDGQRQYVQKIVIQ